MIADVQPIDAVVTWVDGNDEEWRARKEQALICAGLADPEAKSDARYRDWGTFRYWFRGLESFAPWLRSIILVTEGHVPDWLDLDNPKLRVVRHADFMPEEYLPTFSSRAIELNMHRIADLSEVFVYFNDDMYLTAPTPRSHFVRRGLPAGVAVAKALHSGGITDHASLNAVHVLNRHIAKQDAMRAHPLKFFSPRYGLNNLRTLALMPWSGFTGFQQLHLPQVMLTRSFRELWELEHEWLDRTSRQRFRDHSGLNPYVITYWQLATGEFAPVSPRRFGTYRQLGVDDIDEIAADITAQDHRIVCVNDGPVSDFEADQATLVHALQKILPARSSFEKPSG